MLDAEAARRLGTRRGRIGEHALEERRLLLIPDVPPPERRLQRTVAHARAKDRVGRIAKRAIALREDGDVVTARERVGLDAKAADALERALGDDVVEQYGVEPPLDQVGVRVHVVVVGDGDQPRARLFGQQHAIRERRPQRPHAPAGEIIQRTIARAVGPAHGEHLAELEVRQRRAVPLVQLRTVLDPRQPHVEVAPLHRGVDRSKGHLDEPWRASESLGDHLGDLDVKAAHAVRVRGIGFDIRGAALGIAAPPQHGGALAVGWRRRPAAPRERHRECQHHHPAGDGARAAHDRHEQRARRAPAIHHRQERVPNASHRLRSVVSTVGK
jgi:hypothetical protein